MKVSHRNLSTKRVRQGSHNVPEQVIHPRFFAGLKNFNSLDAPLANAWSLAASQSRAIQYHRSQVGQKETVERFSHSS
ncbi:MAG: hypothetical protein ACYDB9_01475 [Gammaproteobacteria bacterium]